MSAADLLVNLPNSSVQPTVAMSAPLRKTLEPINYDGRGRAQPRVTVCSAVEGGQPIQLPLDCSGLRVVRAESVQTDDEGLIELGAGLVQSAQVLQHAA